MSEFKKMLPKGKQADKIVKSLENIEVNNIRSYLVKSFSTFTNPNYVPDEKIYNDAVSWVADNIVRKNKDLFELISSEKIKIDQITKYPLEDVAQAHTDIENRKTTGSVILEI